MNPDLAQFREKLVRLRDQADQALFIIDSGRGLYDTPLTIDEVNLDEVRRRRGFSIGDFTVLDRFSTFTKGPEA